MTTVNIEKIEHNGMFLVVAAPELVILLDKNGRYYTRCVGPEALECAKISTNMYWDEVACFGAADYPEDMDKRAAMHTSFLEGQVKRLEEQIEKLKK